MMWQTKNKQIYKSHQNPNQGIVSTSEELRSDGSGWPKPWYPPATSTLPSPKRAHLVNVVANQVFQRENLWIVVFFICWLLFLPVQESFSAEHFRKSCPCSCLWIESMNNSKEYRKYCEGKRVWKKYSKVWCVEIVESVNILSDNLPIIDIRPALLVFCWITWKEENVSDALSWCNMRFSAYLQWPWYGLSSISPWTNNISMA